MVTVFNMSTGLEQVYSCGAKEAVVCAYAQSLNDWETWNYTDKYGHLLVEGKHSFGCGDFSALKPKPPKTEKNMTTQEKVKKAINRLRFKSNVWRTGATNDAIFQMVNDVRFLSGMDKMTRKLFDDGIRYCYIDTTDYKYSMNEFVNLCCGDW